MTRLSSLALGLLLALSPPANVEVPAGPDLEARGFRVVGMIGYETIIVECARE